MLSGYWYSLGCWVGLVEPEVAGEVLFSHTDRGFGCFTHV